ncbi:hypothetical protein D3C71_1441470 [compost metagenome]
MLTGKADRLFLVAGLQVKEHVAFAEAEQVLLGGLKAVVQRADDFLLVIGGFIGRHQALGQIVVQLAVEEIGQRDVLCLRRMTHRALSQVTVSDHQIHIIRQVVDGTVGHGDIFQPGVRHFFAQYPGPHGAGTHARIAGNDDFTHRGQVTIHRCMSRSTAFRLGLHRLYAASGLFQVILFFGFRSFQQEPGNHKGHHERCGDRRQVGEVSAFRGHRQYRQNRTRRSRRHQTAVQQGQCEHAGHTAQDHRQQQAWIHQHVREVNFVDTTEEVDDRGTAGRLLGTAAAKEHVGHQHAQTRAWVGFDQEEDGFAGFGRLLDAQR